jgi:hypothetical protein
MSQLRLIYRSKLMRQLLKSFKSFLFLSVLVVTACASPPAGVAYDLPAKNKFEHCPYQHFVGSDVGDVQKDLEAARIIFRLLEPDSQMTMDFSEKRVNVVFDPSSKKVERVFCG